MNLAQLDSSGTKVNPTSTTLTGQHVGDQVSLDVAGFGLWQGTLKDGLLTLRIPQRDGTIQSITLTRGGTDTYNNAVQQMQQTAARTQSSIDEAKAQAAQADQIGRARNNLTSALADLQATMGGLPAVLHDYDTAAGQGMNDALAKLQQSLSAAPLDCGEVGYQMGQVEYARGQVSYETGVLESVTTPISDDISSASNDVAALQHAEPSADVSDATSRIASAQQALTAAKKQADHDNQIADAVVATAKQRAGAACPGIG
jgi:hypothetical protein